jgi:hypothetical protein
LEWSLPATWRAEFDLDSYIPTLHSRAKLIEACEAIQQSEVALERPSREESSKSHRNMKRLAARNSTEPQKKQKRDCRHYCSKHDYNSTHATEDCYTLRNRAKATNHAPKADKRSFSNQNLSKEINLLAKTICMALLSRASKPRFKKDRKTPESASQDIIQEEDSGDVCLCHQERASQVRWQQEARKKLENCGTRE